MPGFNKLAPSVRTANSINVYRSMCLKFPQSNVSKITEKTVEVASLMTKRNQPGLQITNMIPLSPDAKGTNVRLAYRNSPISSSNAPLGFAPISFLAGSPFSKTMRAGILIIS